MSQPVRFLLSFVVCKYSSVNSCNPCSGRWLGGGAIRRHLVSLAPALCRPACELPFPSILAGLCGLRGFAVLVFPVGDTSCPVPHRSSSLRLRWTPPPLVCLRRVSSGHRPRLLTFPFGSPGPIRKALIGFEAGEGQRLTWEVRPTWTSSVPAEKQVPHRAFSPVRNDISQGCAPLY